MNVHIIVVGDSDLHDDVQTLWEDAFEGSKDPAVRSPDDVRYLEQAEDRLKKDNADFTVVIVDQRARLNKHEKGEPDLTTMTGRLRDFLQSHARSRVVLCLYEERLCTKQVTEFQRARIAIVWASDAQTMRKHLLEQIKEGISAAPAPDKSKEQAPPLETIAEFCFHVPHPELRLHHFLGGMPVKPSSIQLRGDTALIQRFLESSREVDRVAKEETSNDAGQKFDNAMSLLGEVGAQILVADDLIKEYGTLSSASFREKVRVSFRITTSADRYPCLFEALRIGTRARPVVVEHPTYRSVHFGEDPRLRLAWSRSDPVNILVVVANVPSGTMTVASEGKNVSVSFRSLPFAEEEAKLFSQLKASYDERKPFKLADGTSTGPVRVPIGRVDFLREKDDPQLLSLRLEQALGQPRYNIVHFIGHAYAHSQPSGKIDTRLVLPTGDPPAAEAVTLFQLEDWLQKAQVQFVYFSCCSGIPTEGGAGVNSTSAPIALLFKSIPVTLGFRWDVIDESAFKFAEDFYANLFVHACDFDEAMQKARSTLYNAQSGSGSMWVSPVLLLQ
jgi:hypothetical protein